MRTYGGIFDENSSVWEKFKTMKSRPREEFIPKKEQRKIEWNKKLEEHIKKVKEEYKKCKMKLYNVGNPHEHEDVTNDPYKTIIVAQLEFSVDEDRLKKEFKPYGPIERVSLVFFNIKVKLVRDLEGKSRGYAFIEFEHRRDFLAAFKQADGKRIEGRKIRVDAEMGRIKDYWRPKRFGGGRGDTRRSVKHPYK